MSTIAVLSDTHGSLPPAIFKAIAEQEPDLIVHAGDICGDDILPRLEMLAPVRAVLGNNDYYGEYGWDVRSRAEFEFDGIDFEVQHIFSPTTFPLARVSICGHTHVAKVESMGACSVVNPGSVSRPRDGSPSFALIKTDPGYVRSIQIVRPA